MSHLPSRQSHTKNRWKQSFSEAVLFNITLKNQKTSSEIGIELVFSFIGNLWEDQDSKAG